MQNTFIPIEYAFGTDANINVVYLKIKNIDSISVTQAMGRCFGRPRKNIETVIMTENIENYHCLALQKKIANYFMTGIKK